MLVIQPAAERWPVFVFGMSLPRDIPALLLLKQQVDVVYQSVHFQLYGAVVHTAYVAVLIYQHYPFSMQKISTVFIKARLIFSKI